MTADIVPHPQPKPSRKIVLILWVSMIVSTFAFAFSMVGLGAFSAWTVPAAYGLSIAHNITLLVLSAKDRKKSSEEHHGTLTATSKKATIICTWLLMLFWMGITALMLAFIIILTSRREFEGIFPSLEFSFSLVEVGVMGFLGVQCVRERRRIIGLANMTK